MKRGESGSKISFDETKLVLLDMISDLDRYCRENGLRYSLAYGTLIGAVRHKGFIPWDDDIDIYIPRTDYLRFIREYNHPYYKVMCQEKDPSWPLNFAKLCDTRTVSIDSFGNKSSIAVDLFILDGLSDSYSTAQRIVKRVNRLYRIWSNQLFTCNLSVAKQFGIKKNLFIIFAKVLHCFLPIQKLVDYMCRYRQKFSIDNSKYCASLEDQCFIFETEKMLKYQGAQFENLELMIGAEYDYQLRRIFGDYMILPPEGQRINHEAIAYWK